jgi:hypothetical protein
MNVALPVEGLAVVLGGIDPVVFQSSGSSNRGLASLAMSVVFFVFGAVMLYSGFDQWRVKRLIQDTPTEQVRSAAVGRTELRGVAKPAYGTVDRPFTEGDALYADWEIEEHENSDGDSDWVTVDGGEAATRFDLDDGTGAVEVAASTDTVWEVSEDNRTAYTVEEGESPPPPAQSFLENRADESDPEVGVDDRRRYSQTVVPPEADVYVFGAAVERDGAGGSNEQRLVVERDDGSERFIVSDMTESNLHDSLGQRAPALVVLGLLVCVGGFFGVLWSLGVA